LTDAQIIPDLHAPIVPGVSSAGILIGTTVEALVASTHPAGASGEHHGFHRFPSIKVWSIEGTVRMVGVSEGYRGQVDGRIGIGSTLGDVEDWCACKVDRGKYNTLIATGMPGLSFITDISEGWNDDVQVGIDPTDRLTTIFVHQA
jgi:hypothetical protein